MPIHCLEPLEKEAIYFSSPFPPSSRSAQRSGRKEWESGNIFSLWCCMREDIEIGVWELGK